MISQLKITLKTQTQIILDIESNTSLKMKLSLELFKHEETD